MKLLVLGLLLLAACAPQRLPVAFSQPAVPPETAQGQAVYMRFCQQCHPGGAAGLGPSLNDKPLPAFLIGFQVRQGLGAMPAFGPDAINDSELRSLEDYVVWMHRQAKEGR